MDYKISISGQIGNLNEIQNQLKTLEAKPIDLKLQITGDGAKIIQQQLKDIEKQSKIKLDIDSSGFSNVNKETRLFGQDLENANRIITETQIGAHKTKTEIQGWNTEGTEFGIIQTKLVNNYKAQAAEQDKIAKAAQIAHQAEINYLAQQRTEQEKIFNIRQQQAQVEFNKISGVKTDSGMSDVDRRKYEVFWAEKLTAESNKELKTQQAIEAAISKTVAARQQQSRKEELEQAKAINKEIERQYIAQQKISDSVEVLKTRVQGLKLTSEQRAKIEERISQIMQMQNVSEQQQSLKILNAEISNMTKNSDSLGDAVKRVALQFFSLQQAARLIRDAFADMRNIDTQLTELSKVTDLVRENFQEASIAAVDAGNKWGRTASDFLEASTIFARAGAENYNELAEVSILAQSAGDITAELASKYLIASNAAFGLGNNTDKLTALLDGQNQVTNRNSVSMQDMADATRVYANTAAIAGETTQTMTALIATGVGATQRSGTEVANALRTISMRIRQIKGESEGEIIDQDSMAKAEKSLDSIGVAVRNVEDGVVSLRQPTEVLGDLAAKFEAGQISAEKLSQVLEAVAGQRQADILAGLIQNWDLYGKAMSDYTDATGSAANEAQKDLESWDGKMNILSNTWTKFVAKTVNTEWIKGLLDGTTGLINAFDNLGTAVFAFGGIMLAIKLPAIIALFLSLGKTLSTVAFSFNYATATGAGLSTTLNAMGVAASTAQLAIGALTIVITAGIMLWNTYNQKQEEAKQKAIELGDTFNSQLSTISKLKDEINDETASRETLVGLMTSHNEKYGEELSAITDVNEAREKSIQLLDDEAKKRAEEIIRETGSQFAKSEEFLKSPYSIIESGYETPQRALDDLTISIDKYNKKIEDGTKLNIIEQRELGILEDAYRKVKEQIEESEQIIKSYDDANAVLNGTFQTQSDIVNETKDSFDSVTEVATINAEELEKLSDVTESLGSSAQTLSSAFKEQSESGQLSFDTIMSLIDAGYAAALSIDTETGAVTINKEAYLQLTEAKIQTQIATLNIEKSNIESKLNNESSAVLNLSNSYIRASQAKMIFANAGTSEDVGNLDNINAQIAALEELSKNIGSVTAGTYTSSYKSPSATSKKDQKKDYSDITEELIRSYKAEYDRLSIQEELIDNNLKLLKGQENSATYIELQNQKLKIQSQEMESLVGANNRLYEDFNKIVQANQKYDVGSWFDAKYQATVAYKNLLNSVSAEEQKIIENLFKQAQNFGQAILDNNKTIDSLLTKMQSARQEQFEKQRDAEVKALQDRAKALQNQLKDEQKITNERIKALEAEKDSYKDIIDMRKEELRLIEDKNKYEEDIASQEKDINKLQQRIDELALDDSRTAQAERAGLQEELATLVDNLNESQHDRYVDLQEDAYDKEYEAFANNIDNKINDLNDYMAQLEEKTNAQVERINNQIDSIKDRTVGTYTEVIDMNSKYGEEILTLANSWEVVLAALNRYRDALGQINVASAKSGLASELGISESLLTGEAWESASGTNTKKSSTPSTSSTKTSSTSTSSTVTVKSGDTLSEIASRNGTTVSKILVANSQIKDANKIYVGDKIKIPKKHDGVTSGFVLNKSLNPESEIFKKLMSGEQLNILKKGELVTTADQMKNFMNNTLPQISKNSDTASSGLSIDNLITINGNVDKTVIPDINKIANEVVGRIQTAFGLNGMSGSVVSNVFR